LEAHEDMNQYILLMLWMKSKGLRASINNFKIRDFNYLRTPGLLLEATTKENQLVGLAQFQEQKQQKLFGIITYSRTS
jgi:hypothetical protein